MAVMSSFKVRALAAFLLALSVSGRRQGNFFRRSGAFGRNQEANLAAPSTPEESLAAPSTVNATTVAPVDMNHTIKFGECGLYINGTAQLTLCITQYHEVPGVQQVKGLLYNNGTTDICGIKLKAVGTNIYGVWPDWAGIAEWENYFLPKQYSAAGITSAFPGAPAHLEVASFYACTEKDAKTVEQVQFSVQKFDNLTWPETVLAQIKADPDITTEPQDKTKAAAALAVENAVQVDAAGKVLTMAAEEPMAAKDTLLFTGQEAEPSIRSANPPHLLTEKQCDVYQNGTAQLALCVTMANKWATTEQVSGFLINIGDVMVCNIKVKASGAKEVHSLWPDWAVKASWEAYFHPEQYTLLGIVATPEEGFHPYAEIVSFQACDAKEESEVNYTTVAIDTLVLPEKLANSSKTATASARRVLFEDADEMAGQGLLFRGTVPDADGKAAPKVEPIMKVVGPENPPHLVQEKLCDVYKNGTAELTICWTMVNKWEKTEQVSGFMLNTGDVFACHIQVKPAGATEVHSIWPDWAAKAAWENYFHPKQFTYLGVVGTPEDALHPYVELVSFHACGATGKSDMSYGTIPLEQVQIPPGLKAN